MSAKKKQIEIVVPALAISEHTVKIVASTLTVSDTSTLTVSDTSTLTVLDPTVMTVTSTLIGPEPTFTTKRCPLQQVISYCRNNAFTWPPPHRWSALYWCVVTMSAMFVIYAYAYSLGPLKRLRTRPKGKTEEKDGNPGDSQLGKSETDQSRAQDWIRREKRAGPRVVGILTLLLITLTQGVLMITNWHGQSILCIFLKWGIERRPEARA